MPFHVRDPEVDAKVRRFAQQRGVGITEAIGLAVDEANQSGEQRKREKLARMRAVSDRIATYPKTGLKADKAFFDELSGDGD